MVRGEEETGDGDLGRKRKRRGEEEDRDEEVRRASTQPPAPPTTPPPVPVPEQGGAKTPPPLQPTEKPEDSPQGAPKLPPPPPPPANRVVARRAIPQEVRKAKRKELVCKREGGLPKPTPRRQPVIGLSQPRIDSMFSKARRGSISPPDQGFNMRPGEGQKLENSSQNMNLSSASFHQNCQDKVKVKPGETSLRLNNQNLDISTPVLATLSKRTKQLKFTPEEDSQQGPKFQDFGRPGGT